MNRFLSQKLRFYSFICIALLGYVHGYNLKVSYLNPSSMVDEPLTFTAFFEYLLANGLLRFRIPILFLISGYIYALQDSRPYKERIKKRFITLIIPYLIWSAVGILITFLWQSYPPTARAINFVAIDQLGDNRPYTEIGWVGVVNRWLFFPIAFQLWFIRVLFVYNVCYPGIRWLLNKVPWFWLSICAILWYSNFNLYYFIEGQGLFFFSLGIWLQKNNISIERKPNWFSLPVAWIFFIGFSIIKTFMAFEMDQHSIWSYRILQFLYAASIVSGVMAVWFGGDKLVRWCMQKKWFTQVSSFSFTIFGLHNPLVIYCTGLVFIYLAHIANFRLLTYILMPLLIVAFCVGVGALFRKVWPSGYRWATGGRGLGQ